MPVTKVEYQSQVITLNQEESPTAELKINDQVINYQKLENGQFHSDYIPYQDFDDLIELAKYIIDYLPNLKFNQ